MQLLTQSIVSIPTIANPQRKGINKQHQFSLQTIKMFYSFRMEQTRTTIAVLVIQRSWKPCSKASKEPMSIVEVVEKRLSY